MIGDETGDPRARFLASLNHEVRTPLSGILGMTDLLLETTLDEEQKEYVEAARLCAENLLEQVFGAQPRRFHVFLLFLVERCLEQQIGHPQDAAEWRPHLVVEARQKTRSRISSLVADHKYS